MDREITPYPLPIVQILVSEVQSEGGIFLPLIAKGRHKVQLGRIMGKL